jgi:hypothetical protein
MPQAAGLVRSGDIASKIHTVRGVRVMLDEDLAPLYGVTTKRLNQQVSRNLDRFPADFMFTLSPDEGRNLKLQTATSSSGWGGRRKPHRAFTEHGAVMLASVLNSAIAVAASIQVVRAFVQLRGVMVSHRELARRLDELENRYDAKFKVVFRAIRELMQPPALPRKRIGFR